MSRVCINGIAFPVLVAATMVEQARGLMWQSWPPPVMCFPYKQAGVKKFWMKNTPSPLDIVFCHNDTIVGIFKGEPMSTMLVGPETASDLVVEFPFGTVSEYNIKIGDQLKLIYSEQDAARIIKEAF